jgi:hypothetical protein
VARREHTVGRGRLARTLDRMLDDELDRLSAGRSLAFGASCVVAARRA